MIPTPGNGSSHLRAPGERSPKKDIQALFDDGREIDRALREAVREAVLTHKKMGWPIVEWRDGKVVWTPAEEIVVSEFPEPSIGDVQNPAP